MMGVVSDIVVVSFPSPDANDTSNHGFFSYGALASRQKKLRRRTIQELVVQFDEQGAQLLQFLVRERGKERLDMAVTLFQDLVKEGKGAGGEGNGCFAPIGRMLLANNESRTFQASQEPGNSSRRHAERLRQFRRG